MDAYFEWVSYLPQPLEFVFHFMAALLVLTTWATLLVALGMAISFCQTKIQAYEQIRDQRRREMKRG
jgi:hypothetical protein